MTKFLTLLTFIIIFGCQSVSQDPLKSVELETASGEIIKTSIVYTAKDQTQGLSGVKPNDFDDDQGMIFFYLEDGERHFWMPDTYFDLDIIFLDKNLKVTDIIRKLPHYVGMANQELIPRARGVWARHALEMKATSPISLKIKIGDQLKWKSSMGLEETEKKIRENLKF